MVLKLSHNPTHLSPVRLWHSRSVPSTELLQEVLMGLGLLYAKCEQGSLLVLEGISLLYLNLH
jgi:hypothetical protein